MNLTNLLLNGMTGDASVKALQEKSGASGKQIRMLLMLAIPLLIKYLTNNASSQSGHTSLLNALMQHTNTEPIANQIANADQNDGNAIIGHILGGNNAGTVNQLSSQTGMSSQQVSTILNSLAPALLSGLSQAASSAGSSGFQAQAPVQQQAPAQNEPIQFLGGSQQSSSGSGLGNLLGGMLGGGSQPSGTDLLGTLLGGGSQESLGLGSLLGGQTQQGAIDGTDLLSLLLRKK